MPDHTFDDDPAHPIPQVDVIDTVVVSVPTTVARLSKLQPGHRYIYVFIPAGSSAEVRATLAECKSRAEADGIRFAIRED